jgi:hypothetical protein
MANTAKLASTQPAVTTQPERCLFKGISNRSINQSKNLTMQIDDGKLSSYYVAQSTEYGIYYAFQTLTPGYLQGFYTAGR